MIIKKMHYLNVAIITIVIAFTITLQNALRHINIFNPIVDFAISICSSIGFYKAITTFVYFIFSNNKFLLKMYWGGLYLDGFWSYEYEIDTTNGKVKRVGAWQFKQDLYKIEMTGKGFDDNGHIRTTANSVTSLIERDGAYEITKRKINSDEPELTHYSRTTMYLNGAKRVGITRAPVKFDAISIIYGGSKSGEIHKDTFVKHAEAESFEDILNIIMVRQSQLGSI